jgi:elongation factor G
VAYRETVSKAVELEYCHKKQSDGSGEFAAVRISVEPGEAGSGLVCVDAVKSGNLRHAYVRAVERGIHAVGAGGSLLGFPLTDLTVTILDGKWHDLDSSPSAFEIAGSGAMREGVRKAGVRLLEPIVKLVVLTEDEHLHAIRDTLQSRAAFISHVIESDGARILVATSPAGGLFGFEAELETLSDGRARSIMQLDHYEPVEEKPDPDDDFPLSAALRA